jgi:hypothetical protein
MKFRTVSVIGAMLLAGCKTDTLADPTQSAEAAKKQCLDGSMPKGTNGCPTAPTTATTTPTPTPTPTPTSTTVLAQSLRGEADIADNFDVSQWLEPGQ